jgi:hypothetical protein
MRDLSYEDRLDRVSRAIGGDSPTLALPGSTEAAQFEAEAATATRSLG